VRPVRAFYRRSVGVLAGPSLPPADRIEAADVVYLPPASRGDVIRAAREFDLVLVIDGVFHHDLAPSPKECFEATRHARMFGASSMGALRAAECAPYGFTPLGAIARWYASGAIDGDDEVAVLTDPRTNESLSVPLVDVRYVLRLAQRRGVLTAAECGEMMTRARDVFYMERTWDDVLDVAPRSARASLVPIAAGVSLKRLDARFALRTVLRSRALAATALPERVPKARGTYDRSVPFVRTLQLLPQLRERYGITRVADTTRLDRTGVPTFSAMVPNSPDVLGVYNGKGLTREAAIASAVMEAAERQIGASIHMATFRESLETVGQRLDLELCGVRDDARTGEVECVRGIELFSGDAVPVPVAMVQCPYRGPRLFDVTSSNGLASGNNLTEAIYHALCELIERHAWSIYHVRCSVAPRFFKGTQARDVSLAPEIALPCGEPKVDALVEQVRSVGLIVRAILLDEPPLPPTVLATVTEPNSSPPMAHMGLGCSLSPAHALTRALTEAVQSRVTDIQAAREDILRANEPAGETGSHARRITSLPTDQWYYTQSQSSVAIGELADRSSDDLAEDLRRTLRALRTYGIASAVAVDLSPVDLPMSVVRAIVPGLEAFTITGHAGPRVRAELNPFAVRPSA
jgi:ribosomal protein S12 methylthiotransferase accessory factor